jgi:hypothetical protein
VPTAAQTRQAKAHKKSSLFKTIKIKAPGKSRGRNIQFIV